MGVTHDDRCMDGSVKRYAGLVDGGDGKYVHKMAWNNAVRTTAR